jgi:predicted component of type VI protein secretion system
MKKYFLLLAMVFVGLVACEKTVEPGPDTPVDDPTKQPELTLTSEAVLNFAAEGGQGTVTYTLTNV